MNRNSVENEQLKLHIENRNEILFKLYAYSRDWCRRTSEGHFTCSLWETNRKSQSSILEDLLVDMNCKRFDDNTNCYRCKHFLNVPENLFSTCDRISDYTVECEADLNFVQAVVWLKSATAFNKDILVEQFQQAFNKQWINVQQSRTNCSQGSFVWVNTRESSINSLFDTHETDVNFVTSKSVYAGSIDSLRNIRSDDGYSISQKRQYEGNDISVEKWKNPNVFVSSPNLSTFINVQSCTQNRGSMNNRNIISDSEDKEHLSSSDIFRDSTQSQGDNKITGDQKTCDPRDKDEFAVEKTVEKFFLRSPCSSIAKDIIEQNDLPVISDTDESSDIAPFNHDSATSTDRVQLRKSLTSESNARTDKPLTQESGTNIPDKDFIIPPSSPSSFQEDSAYDTYLSPDGIWQSSAICICEIERANIFSTQRIHGITPYQKDDDDANNNACVSKSPDADHPIDKDFISQQNQSHASPSVRDNEESTDLIKTSCSHDITACEGNRCTRTEENSTQYSNFHENRRKRKKLAAPQAERRKEEYISSEWLRFTLDKLNVVDVASESVKVILSVLQHEGIAKQYMRKKYWRGTLEEQAVNAILNFSDVFEAEKKSNACTQKIVRTVIGTLDKIINSQELNKVIIFTHQISIILQLCTAMNVCIETIDYLTAKLKCYDDILIALRDGKRANIWNVVNQLHIIFYALTICLQQYRSVFPDKGNNQMEEEIVPPVIALWKEQCKYQGTIAEEESAQKREHRWLMALDNFTAIAAEHFVQFSEKSRKLANLLTHE